MNLQALVLGTAIAISVLYLGMAFYAFAHVDQDKKAQHSLHLLSLTLWWPFYDIYDLPGSKMRKPGVIVLMLGALAYVSWAVVR